MNINSLKDTSDLQRFLDGNQAVAFQLAGTKSERYSQMKRLLDKFNYLKLKRADKGILIAFLVKITGLSRQQVTRLIKQYRETGIIRHYPKTTHGFQKKYHANDVHLLAKLDERHGTLNGHATKKLIERAYEIHGQQKYEQLRYISVSHLYNLRQSTRYQSLRRHYTKTRYKASQIGIRRAPSPEGKPGYIRVDTVHQGDLDGIKGVYHINAVDIVTQFQVIVSLQKISEAYLLPALAELIEQFPFKIKGFHSDNGSEYINKAVAELLNKNRIEMTKSRPRHSNDNALAETKNGAVIRKQFGYAHISQKHAEKLNDFNRRYLNPYINYHRPSLFPTITTDKKGKQCRRYHYDNLMTPYEKLKSICSDNRPLKAGLTFDALDKIAQSMTDDQAADRLNNARQTLFQYIMNKAS